MNKVIINTDGGAIGNPGLAGIGVVIKTDGKIKEYSESIGEATNNQAEYRALIFALKKAKLLLGKTKIKELEIECRMDSELLVKQINGEYKIMEKELQPLFLELWNLKIDFKNVKFIYVPREQNTEADALVRRATQSDSKPLF
jgi:ribonuclease HI